MPTIQIQGMSCQHCVGSVTKALLTIDGITTVDIDLATGEARYKEDKPVALATIKAAIAGIGFTVL